MAKDRCEPSAASGWLDRRLGERVDEHPDLSRRCLGELASRDSVSGVRVRRSLEGEPAPLVGPGRLELREVAGERVSVGFQHDLFASDLF